MLLWEWLTSTLTCCAVIWCYRRHQGFFVAALASSSSLVMRKDDPGLLRLPSSCIDITSNEVLFRRLDNAEMGFTLKSVPLV